MIFGYIFCLQRKQTEGHALCALRIADSSGRESRELLDLVRNRNGRGDGYFALRHRRRPRLLRPRRARPHLAYGSQDPGEPETEGAGERDRLRLRVERGAGDRFAARLALVVEGEVDPL
jgi:hypothetical protein